MSFKMRVSLLGKTAVKSHRNNLPKVQFSNGHNWDGQRPGNIQFAKTDP